MGKMNELDQRIQEATAAVRAAFVAERLRVSLIDCVGTAYINDKSTSDLDILVYCERGAGESGLDCMQFDGWVIGGSTHGGLETTNADKWISWKKDIPGVGEVNMLVTTSLEYFNAWLTSAEVCRYLHLQHVPITREQRISIHNIVMDDSTADYENSPLVCR